MTTLIGPLQQAVKTSSQWATQNPILLAGQVGFESNTRNFKLGDGLTAWNALPYADSGGGAIDGGTASSNETGTAAIDGGTATSTP